MGITKQSLELTYDDPPERFVCQICIGEVGLQEFVYENGSPGTCSYCSDEYEKVCSLTLIVPHVDSSLRLEYTEAAIEILPYDEETEDFAFETFGTSELLENLGLEADFSLVTDISDCLHTNTWCSIWSVHQSEDEEYEDAWSKFKNMVQRKNRFIFLNAKIDDPEQYARFKTVSDFLTGLAKIQNEFIPTRNLEIGTQIFRCRGTNDLPLFELTVENLGPPRFEIAAKVSNRMSPAGVSMFYGALKEETAVSEVKNQNFEAIATAEFLATKRLVLIDLTAPLSIPSIFNDNLNAIRSELKIINNFAMEISRQCTPDNLVHVEYVPTQIITEFFRQYYFENGQRVDGIIYQSSQHQSGECIVLFFDSNDCTDGVSTNKPLYLKSAHWCT